MKIPSLKVEEHVTWKALLFLLASFGAFLLTLVGIATARAEDAATKASVAARQAVSMLEVKVDANKREADAGTGEVRKDIQAVYNFLLTRQRQERLEAKK